MYLKNISEISNYTVVLYREKFNWPRPIGSGILIKLGDKHFIISAYHVIDNEDEVLEIENDPDEIGIPHGDMESVMAKISHDTFFYVDDKVKGVILNVRHDEETAEGIFSDEFEWCSCELGDEEIYYFKKCGKLFFDINEIPTIHIEEGAPVIVSGFPLYAQKEDQEVYRSYKSEFIGDTMGHQGALFRVKLDNDKAYNFELKREVRIHREMRISGMSGGGLWYETNAGYVPIGIIIKQDPNEKYIEGVYIHKIIESILNM